MNKKLQAIFCLFVCQCLTAIVQILAGMTTPTLGQVERHKIGEGITGAYDDVSKYLLKEIKSK